MAADRVRSGSASRALNGMGLPESSTVTAAPQPQQGSLAVMSVLPRTGSSSQQQMRLEATSRDGATAHGVLLGSLTEYRPGSAVTYANWAAAARASTGASAAVPYPSTSAAPALCTSSSRNHSAGSPLEALSLSALGSSENLFEHKTPGARQGGVRGSGAPPLAPFQHRTSLDAGLQGGDVIASQDLRGSKHSIAVLKVTPGGRAQECTRPPTSDSTFRADGGWSTPGVHAAPVQPPRRTSFNQVGSTTQLDSASAGVQVERIAPISETSLLTVFRAHPAMPQAVAAAELRQRPPQRSSTSSSAAIDQPSPCVATTTAAPVAATKSTHPAAFPMPSSTTTSSPAAFTQHTGSRLSCQSSYGAPRSTHSPERSTTVSTAVSTDAALHHRPSCNGAVREAGEPLLIGPSTLQVSTTTLTKTTKKVRYRLPDEPFDPDAPDPSEIGGLKAEEEAALLDPVSYTCAVDEVAGRYPMLLRRPSAQGGDVLRGRCGAASSRLGDGALRPTFLLNDGNRWARATNRPTVATTRDPSGTATTQLPAPRILQKTGVAGKTAVPDTNSGPFPAHQRVAADGNTAQASDGEEAGGHLLQRHVQQIATGKQLVKGTAFQPPSIGKLHTVRCRREQDEDRMNAAAAAQSALKDKGSSAVGAAPPESRRRRSGNLEGFYAEILRRTQQNRRTTLPTTIPPAAVPPQALPLQPPGAAARAARPTTERRSWRPHLSSAEPAPPQRGSGVNPGVAPRLPHTAPQPWSSSQPCIPISHEETPSDSEMSSRNGYRTPLMYSAPQREQQAPTPLARAGAAATGGAGPRLSNSVLHPSPCVPQPYQQQVVPPGLSFSLTRGPPPLAGGGHPVEPNQHLDSASPRPQQQQQCPSPHVRPGYGVAAAALSTGSHMPEYTSGRSGKYTSAVFAPPPPPASELDHLRRSSGGKPCDRVSGSHAPPPPPARAQPSQHPLSSSSYGNSAYRRDEEDGEGYNAAPFDSHYPADEAYAAGTHTTSVTVTAFGRNSAGAPEQHSCATHVHGAPQVNNSTGSSSQQRSRSWQHAEENLPQRTAAVHKENLRAEGMERPHDEGRSRHRTHGSVLPPPPHPPPTTSAAASSSTAQRTAAGVSGHLRYGSSSSNNAVHSTTLWTPAAAANAPTQTSHAAFVTSQAEYDEALMSTSSCTTDTQPVAVSECGEDEIINDEDDGLVKKGPPVLVLGDEVFAPDGYEYVKEGDEYAEYDEQYNSESEDGRGHHQELEEAH